MAGACALAGTVTFVGRIAEQDRRSRFSDLVDAEVERGPGLGRRPAAWRRAQSRNVTTRGFWAGRAPTRPSVRQKARPFRVGNVVALPAGASIAGARDDRKRSPCTLFEPVECHSASSRRPYESGLSEVRK